MLDTTIRMDIKQELEKKINAKTKPLGSLGMLEEIALQIGLIQQSVSPQIINPHIIVFAADHGIAETGLVNPYPQAVTAQMVLNYLNGGAAINVFCRQNNIVLKVVDAGVNYDWPQGTKCNDFIEAKMRHGTRNYLLEMAMTEEEVNQAINIGRSIVDTTAASGCNTIGFGEMGISNTSSAALIMSAILNMPLEECVGRGTGINDEQLNLKINTLQDVHVKLGLYRLTLEPLKLLSAVGGFEIAMITGAYLQAAKQNMVIVVDGFIATASLLIAHTMNHSIVNNCVFAHCSGEQGHQKMLDFLGARPFLNLGLRLGEGTGAALAIPLIKSSVAFLNEMASFEEAGVSTKQSEA